MTQIQANSGSESKPVIGRRELCRQLGISRSTVVRLLEAGEFPLAWKTDGGHWRVPQTDVTAYLASRRVKPGVAA